MLNFNYTLRSCFKRCSYRHYDNTYIFLANILNVLNLQFKICRLTVFRVCKLAFSNLTLVKTFMRFLTFFEIKICSGNFLSIDQNILAISSGGIRTLDLEISRWRLYHYVTGQNQRNKSLCEKAESKENIQSFVLI